MSIYMMRNVDIESGGGIDSNTKLMLHCDGANGSTTFTDSSGSPKTATVYGNSNISTSKSKFGGSSAYFDGSGDYLDFGTSSDLVLGTTDFTVDLWINPSSVNSTFRRFFTSTIVGFTLNTFCLRLSNANKITFANSVFTLASTTTAVAGTWYHVAVVKKGGTTKLYINGVNEASASDSNNYSEPLRYVSGNYNGTSEQWHGYLDEVRISKVARWTSNFTPPTEAYSTPTVTPTNTNVKVKNIYRSFGGVNREVSRTDRSFGGVNRLVFDTSEPLYNLGIFTPPNTLTEAYYSANNGTVTLNASNIEVYTTGGSSASVATKGFYFTNSISTIGKTKIKFTFKIISYTVSGYPSVDLISSGISTTKNTTRVDVFTAESGRVQISNYAVGQEYTVECDLTSYQGNYYPQFALFIGSTSGNCTLQVTKIWLE